MSHPIWTQCLSYLEDELSSQQYNTWILPLQINFSGNHLKLLAPNRFILDWIKNNCFPRILEIIDFLDDSKAIEVTLNIGTTHKEEKPQTSLPQKNRSFFYESGLNVNHTFDSFVEGKSNSMARAASIRVSSLLDNEYNPLYLYGGVGLGKTHLMHAVGNQIKKDNPDAVVVYVNCERFIQDMVKALQHNKIDDFKKHYRGVDALLIDDIQFLADKNRSQEEFFHTFNSLYESNAQMIITCDRYPKEIDGLEDRIISRLGWGLAVDIKPPDLETRVAILQSKVSQYQKNNEVQREIPNDVAFFIAQNFKSNIRDLEGAIKRLLAQADFTNSMITMEFTKSSLKDLLSVQTKIITIQLIQKTVCDYYKLRTSDLLSARRTRSITRPRQLAMSLCKEFTRHSLPEIGDAFGGRDHTTVLHACRQIKKLVGEEPTLRDDYDKLERILSS